MSDSHQLLLIDGLNFLRRIYEAIPVPDSEEKAQGAIRATCGSIKKALKELQPSHVLVAVDHGGETWRHRLHPAYKEARKPMPCPLRLALVAFCAELLELGVTSVMPADVEADDVIGTACRIWTQSRTASSVTVLSSDKDFAQLVAHGVRLRDPFKKEWRDEAWILAKYEVAASQVLDLFALTGDSSDGVPGVPGVGPKTAAKWLNTYGSLDALLSEASAIKGKVGDALRTHSEQVLRARQLISLKDDVPLGLTWNSVRYNSQTEGKFLKSNTP